MTNNEILRVYYAQLNQINEAINSLSVDTRRKAVQLRQHFIDLKENILLSIESLETHIALEQTTNV
jgi:hypothetical protein